MTTSELINGEGKKPGASSLLKQALLAIQQTQARLEAAERRNSEPIAVVGLGCRFPGGVVDGESFWELLKGGRDAITAVPADRWDADAYFDPDPDKPGKMVTRRGGFLDRVDGFDARFFEIAPREAAGMDPQQRLALEVAWETLENAGYAPASLHGTRTGVFLGIGSNDYSQLTLETGDAELLDAHYASGVAHSIASGRISYLLGLEGPSISLDTACSSSLVAVHLACQSLRAGDCTVALAGGVNVMLAPETTALLSRVRMLSPDGRCKAFDEGADGFVRAEGCGFVALKRLWQAQADGDRILAVIRGTAVNQDGASSSLTAPNGPSQVNLMRQALTNAGLQPSRISYVEAHGTGTALGDPIELQAIGAVYGTARPNENPLPVGSLKTNLGHLEAAAGVAGLIKAILALEHRQIPPHLHLQRPTPHVRWDELRLTVPTKLTEWESGEPRIAAVSSFGFSGTNAHVVVEEACCEMSRSEAGWPVQILTVSAKSDTALRNLVQQYREYLERHSDADLRDFCYTANTGRSHFSHRACFVAPDVEALKQQLAAFEPTARREPADDLRLGFLFTGQGSQYVGMGGELYASSPVFREAMERCAAAWRQETGESLMEVLYPEAGEGVGKNAGSGMEQARYAQPALFALEYALAEMWQSWGIAPSVLLGHSLGEYVAAVVAGVFRLEDGMRLVCARARLMETLSEPGAMQTISATAARVREAIAGYEKEVSIAAINSSGSNGPQSVVISGAAEGVAEVAAKLEGEGVRTRALQVTHGFHSPLLEPILQEFEECARQVKYDAPRMRIISNLTGKAAGAEEIATPRYWREHMRGTVLFDAGLRTALATGCHTFIEIGPQPHLLALGKSTHSSPNLSWLPSIRKGRNPWLDILNAMQTLYEGGAEIDWKALHGKSGHPMALPTYPFERQRHWFQKNKPQARPPLLDPAAPGHPLLGARVRSPLAKIQFESRIGPDHPAYLGDHVVAGNRVVPAAAYLEMALSAAAAVIAGESTALRDIAFLRPCIFDEPRILQCVMDSKEDRSAFAIYSRSETGDETEWVLHATGEIAREQSSDVREKTSPGDLDSIRERCVDEVDASVFYRAFDENDARFGPSFRTVSRVSRGPGEALVDLEFTSSVQADAGLYRIHPVALDACFQAVVASLSTSMENGTVYLPAALESLHIVGDPQNLTSAHARIRDEQFGDGAAMIADVRGFDAAGNVLVYGQDLVLRPWKQERRDVAQAPSISRSFYEVVWVPVQAVANQELDLQGTCVLAGDETMVQRLSAVFEKRGICYTAIQPDEISAEDPERNWAAVLERIATEWPAQVREFIYIGPLATEDVFHLPAERLMQLQRKTLGECLRIAQALLRMDQKRAPRFWIVTGGGQGPGAINVQQSSLWGFGCSVAAEHPEMRVVRIDLDPSSEPNAEELLRCMPTAAIEEELALRDREMYAPRLRPIARHSGDSIRVPSGERSNRRLELVQAGTLEGLESVKASRRNPGPGEVEIQVAAAGLNFRDVLSVLGMYQGKGGPLGGECAGIVVGVGAGVESPRPGDEVVALGPGCFAEFVTTRANLAWPKPTNLSFEAAVTIPVAFLTAWYALKSLAAIRPGETVLIHAGAGGVGLAAIQIAQKAGAVVFATAGSPEKRAYLTSIGVQHVMDSRSLDFAGGVRDATDGRGVDVVLNSLAGKFIDAGFEALAPGGRFIEMGVADIRSPEAVARLRSDVSYHPFNLAPALEAGDSLIREMLTIIFEQFQAGALQPLPREVFPMENARDAFRYMAQARHIGRVVLCPDKPVSRAVIRDDGAYLVTGGLSGIGLAVAEWLGQRGAAQVIVMGRSSADAEAMEVFHKLRDAGTVVSICQGDVTQEADVATALEFAKNFSLRGVFHCAGVLDDGALLQQDWERFRRVLAPKLRGASNVHRLTADRPLDHFVLFSSIASVFGAPGQTNYAAANALLDGVAQYRHLHRLPALSINWGAWSETGAAMGRGVIERGSKIGMGGISTRDGLAALEELIAGTHTQVVVAPMNWNQYFAIGGPVSNRALLSELRRSELRPNGVQRSELIAGPAADAQRSSSQSKMSWLPQLESAAPGRQQDLLLRLLEDRVQTTLGLSTALAIDPGQPLQELGLDSLLSIELRNSLSASLDRSLPATLLFNYPTLTALARFISREVLADKLVGEQGTQRDNEEASAPLDLVRGIEAMSDEEVDRLLSARAIGSVE